VRRLHGYDVSKELVRKIIEEVCCSLIVAAVAAAGSATDADFLSSTRLAIINAKHHPHKLQAAADSSSDSDEAARAAAAELKQKQREEDSAAAAKLKLESLVNQGKTRRVRAVKLQLTGG
jgi:hypothetical protein